MSKIKKLFWVLSLFLSLEARSYDLQLNKVAASLYQGSTSQYQVNTGPDRALIHGYGGYGNRGYGPRQNNRINSYYDGYGYDNYGYGEDFPGYGRYGNDDSYRYYGPGQAEYDNDLLGYGYGYDFANLPAQGLYYGGDAFGNGGYGPGYGTYQPAQGMSIRYGDGGYGDPNYANFNLNACAKKDQKNCTDGDPDAGQYQWRFVKDIGWRKMGSYGAARKDWWDYKSSVPLPFNFYNFPRFSGGGGVGPGG